MKENNTETFNEGAIVDAKNFQQATRQSTDPLEKEEREKTKSLAKNAPKGAYIAATNIIVDNKKFSRGDDYEGKLYADLISVKAIVTKEEWANR